MFLDNLVLGVDNCQLWTFHRFSNMQDIRIKTIFGGPIANHCFVVAADGRCFSWGRNENGELGHGDLTNVYLPKEVSFPDDAKIVDGSLGAHHSLAYTKEGKLYACGNGSAGQLGIGKLVDAQKTFLAVQGLGSEKVVSTSCGREFSVLASESGSVYTFGHPMKGQLGNGSENKFLEKTNKLTYQLEKVPIKVDMGEDVKIVKVASGSQHSVAMDEDGRVYSWGFGGYGRLGHKDNKDQMTPKAVEYFHKEETPIDTSLPSFMQRRIPPVRATAVCCGATSSFATVGEPYFSLYQWGITKKAGEASMYPKLCNEVSGWKIRSFTCGNTSTMVAAERKTISWGPSPTYGELGYGVDGPKSSTKSKGVDSLNEAIIQKVSMGFSHALAIINVDDPKGPKVVKSLPVFSPEGIPTDGNLMRKRKNQSVKNNARNKKKK